jgi:hypothetical protein
MVKTRRSGTRNWPRSAFAFFWIVLAGLSGVYLFTLLTDPSAFGGQVARLNPQSGQAPVGSELASSSLDADEVSEIKSTLRELSQQMSLRCRRTILRPPPRRSRSQSCRHHRQSPRRLLHRRHPLLKR